MELGLIKEIEISQEMKQSYLDYAMSVIVARAIPDARDGLKPVQRRILYAMYDMGIRTNTPYKKSARIVGEVLGKYHPHGDLAVYESMARLAQDFSIRYPLIDGQGNFGSIDGDPPAAMRYTEARLLPFALELLNQINMETVDFMTNFDETLEEPVVLPSSIPNMLVNGASGIAVGMATNIPPHNLGEIIDALIYLLQRWNNYEDVAVDELMRFVKGPDFPTGGIILYDSTDYDIQSVYGTGRGKIQIRGSVNIEQVGKGKSRIIITELPYQINKSSFIEKIADLSRSGLLEGLTDLRDESDRQGMRIVLELAKNTDIDNLIINLYKKTPLQTTFSVAMLALVNGEPKLLKLKHALKVYLDHRLEIIHRRSEFELRKARERAHILEGLRIAISNLDAVIAIIRNSSNVEVAQGRLIKQFKLSAIQAQAILDMQLKKISSLERKKIDQEYKDLAQIIKELETLLKSPKKIRNTVELELVNIKEKYNNERRTKIINVDEIRDDNKLLTVADLVPEKEVWVGVTFEREISRTKDVSLPRISGKYAPELLLKTNTHNILYIVWNDGKANSLHVGNIQESENFMLGSHIYVENGDIENRQIISIFSIPIKCKQLDDLYINTVSRLGMVKKTNVTELPGLIAGDFIMVKVNDGDEIIWAGLSEGDDDYCLITAFGMGIRFSEKDVRPMGLVAAGVNGIKLKTDDVIVSAEIISGQKEIMILADNGWGWRYPLADFPRQGRYGLGVMVCKGSPEINLVGMIVGKPNKSAIIHFRKATSKTIRMDAVSLSKRMRNREIAVSVKEDDRIFAMTVVRDVK